MTRAIAAVLVVLVATGCEDETTRRAVEICRAEGDRGRADDGVVTVYRDSRIQEATVEAGDAARCEADAARIFATIHAQLPRVPERLRPERLRVHLAPEATLDGPVRCLGADAVVSAAIDEATARRAIAHAALAGPRPTAPKAAALSRAVEEGVAGYYVATIWRPDDDLVEAALPSSDSFVAYFEGGSYRPQIGAALARALWERDPRPGELLEVWRQCLQSGELGDGDEALGPVVEAFVAGCPEEFRGEIRTILARWLPAQLFD